MRRRRGGGKEEEEIPYKYGEAPGEGGNSDIMGWRPQEWRGGTREERCEGGSLVATCAGRWQCVGRDTGASGLGAGRGCFPPG